MRRLSRKIWIALLAGLAMLASCNLFSPPACYYGPPTMDKADEDSISERKKAKQRRADSIREIREGRVCEPVYSVPNIEDRRERLKTIPK
jgi:hypothetical protein